MDRGYGVTPVASWSPVDYHHAFNRCREAWEATSPQMTITGWAAMLDGLDEARTGAACLVEPARPPLATEGGLDSQAYDGRGANPRQDARRGQKGA